MLVTCKWFAMCINIWKHRKINKFFLNTISVKILFQYFSFWTIFKRPLFCWGILYDPWWRHYCVCVPPPTTIQVLDLGLIRLFMWYMFCTVENQVQWWGNHNVRVSVRVITCGAVPGGTRAVWSERELQPVLPIPSPFIKPSTCSR